MSSRSVVSLAVFCAAMALATAQPTVAAGGGGTIPHVRSADAEMLRLLHDGSRRSPTFRHLVDELEHSDVIVYVETAAFLEVPLRAHLRLAGAVPAMRYLRVVVKIPTGADNAIALLGHELRHALEVAHAAEVRDQSSMEALYRRIGEENEAGWETRAAVDTGNLIRDELRRDVRPADADTPMVIVPAQPPLLLKSITKHK